MSLDRPKNKIRKKETPTWEEQQRYGGGGAQQQYRSSADPMAPPKRRSVTSPTAGGRLTRSVSDAGDRDKPLAATDTKRSISLFGTIERIKTKIKKLPTAAAAAAAGTGRKTAAAEPEVRVVTSIPSPPPAPVRAKKQLSPIIESSPRDEYFKYSVGGPLGATNDVSPARPVRGHKVERIVRQLQHQQRLQEQQQQQQQQSAELAAHPSPSSPSSSSSSSPDAAHVHNGNEPFSYTATGSPTIVHLPDLAANRRPPPPPPPSQQQHQYRSAAGMDDTWTSYDDLSHRRDALESRLQKRAQTVVRPPRATTTAGSSSTVRVGRTSDGTRSPDTYATVYKKNETLGGGDRYFERKIVTEHRFARRTPRLSEDGEDDRDDGLDEYHRNGERDEFYRDDFQDGGGTSRRKPPPSRSTGMPTVVSRNKVPVVNGPQSTTVYAEKPAKKRSRLDKFKMLFTGGGSSASKENKRPSQTTKTQYNSSDPESYTSSLRKRYNVFTGAENVSTPVLKV